jgi:hypothetical protein
MYRNVRPRLRSQIGEVRGSLYRISLAEYLAREAAVGGGAGAGAEPSSPPTSKAASQVFCVTVVRDSAAVHGGAGKGSSSWSPKAPPHGTERPHLAAAEHRPEASAAPPASRRRKTIVPSAQPPMITQADLILKKLQDVPERRAAEPDVLVRARYLKTRYAGIIAKSEETLSIRHRQDLERLPAADIDQGSRGMETEYEKALRQEEERNARVGALRKMAREELQEVEKNGRHTGLSIETIHPVHLIELGISAVEHVQSPEGSQDGALPSVPKSRRRRSPLEELGLFVKPVDDSGDEEMENT